MSTSLSFYQKCREKRAYGYTTQNFLNQMSKLASKIYTEIQELNKCVLFDQIINQIQKENQNGNGLLNWKPVGFKDAYIILSIIDWKKGRMFDISNNELLFCSENIYISGKITKEQYKTYRERIRKELKEYLDYIGNENRFTARSSDESYTSSKIYTQKIKIHDKNEGSIHSSDNNVDKSNQTDQNEQNVQQVPPVTQIVEKRILMSEEDVAKIVDERMNLRINSANNVKAFNERFGQLDDDILKIQSSATEVVNQVINFKQELTNNYILQFASSLIDLYDMIADSYDYHQKNIETTDDQNYRNAIFNYETFLEEIIDKLSYLGISTIISEPGDSLNGSYHQVVNTQSFSSRAIVSKSVRAGFMYKDRMLRKERIEVK